MSSRCQFGGHLRLAFWRALRRAAHLERAAHHLGLVLQLLHGPVSRQEVAAQPDEFAEHFGLRRLCAAAARARRRKAAPQRFRVRPADQERRHAAPSVSGAAPSEADGGACARRCGHMPAAVCRPGAARSTHRCASSSDRRRSFSAFSAARTPFKNTALPCSAASFAPLGGVAASAAAGRAGGGAASDSIAPGAAPNDARHLYSRGTIVRSKVP